MIVAANIADFQGLADWLSATSLSVVLQTVTWAIPSLQSVHILALGALMGAAWLLGLRLVGMKVSALAPGPLASRLLPWIWTGLALLALSGGLLIVAEPGELLSNSVMQLKLLMLLVAIGATVAIARLVSVPDAAGARHTPQARPAVRALAVFSLALWVAIAFAGRLIAYV